MTRDPMTHGWISLKVLQRSVAKLDLKGEKLRSFDLEKEMANSSSNSAAKVYKQIALFVEKVDGEMFIQTDVSPRAGDAILDLGCGTGELSAYLADLVGPDGKVVAVDPDKERILLAQQSFGEVKNSQSSHVIDLHIS